MKNKRTFLFVLFAVAILLINNKVSAATSSTPILGYIECSYKIDKYYYEGDWTTIDKVCTNEDCDQHLENDEWIEDDMYEFLPDALNAEQIITFAYSELSFSTNDDYSNVLYVYSAYESYNSGKPEWYPVTHSSLGPGAFGFPRQYYNSGPTTHSFEEMQRTFTTLFLSPVDKSQFTCPVSLVLHETERDQYVPKFTNNLSQLCNNDMSNCIEFGKLVSTPKKEIIYGDEKEWTVSFTESGACNGLGLKVYPDVTSKKFKAIVSRPLGSNLCADNACAERAVDLEIKDADGFYTINYMYNLLFENSIEKIAINGRQQEEVVVLNDSFKNYCSASKVKLTPSYTCTPYLDLQTQLDAKRPKFNESVTTIQTLGKGNLYFKGEKGNNEQENDSQYYSVNDYSNYDNAAALKQKVDDFASYDMAAIKKYIEEYTNIFLTNIESMCTDQEKSAVVEEEKNKTDKDSAETEKWLELLGQELAAISERLRELGDEEGAESAKKIAEDLDAVVESLKHYSESSKNQSFIKGHVSLNYTADCGIITEGLKAWLIRVLDILKVCALVLTLILGMFDFFKGVASGNADTMKKVWTSFSRRLIVVVILFLLPVLIEFVFGAIRIEGIVSNDPLCGIK